MNRFRTETTERPATARRRQDTDLDFLTAQCKSLAEYLEHCRQQHKTVTYLEAADAIDVRPPHRIHQLTDLLEALMNYDQKHHRPLLSALVVSSVRGGLPLPAAGFFLKAQALGLMLTATPEEFHKRCLDRLFGEPGFSEKPDRDVV